MNKAVLIQLASVGIALACALNPSWAADEPMTRGDKILNDYNNDYNCGQVVPMEAVNPVDYSAENLLQGLRLGDETLPLILGDSMDLGGGTLLYQRQGEQWQARIIRMGTSITQVYTNPEHSIYWVFFMHTAEAPGPIEYLYLAQDDTHCGELVSPADLNQPHWNMEYTDLTAFNIDASGNGVVQASADLYEGDETPKTHWYQYQTDDNGKDWSKALPIDKPLSAPTGIWQKVEITKPDPELLKQLTEQ